MSVYVEGTLLEKQMIERPDASPYLTIRVSEQIGFWATIHKIYVFKVSLHELLEDMEIGTSLAIYGYKNKYLSGNHISVISSKFCGNCDKVIKDEVQSNCSGCDNGPSEKLFGKYTVTGKSLSRTGNGYRFVFSRRSFAICFVAFEDQCFFDKLMVLDEGQDIELEGWHRNKMTVITWVGEKTC